MVDRAPELRALLAAPAFPELVEGADVVARLRAAGCVFAEEEAEILLERAGGDAELLEELVSRRAAGAPLEPLVGWVDFGGLRLAVGPGVFVPRQRTLLLARRAVAELEALADRRLSSEPGTRRPASTAPVFVEAFAGVAPIASVVRTAIPGTEVHAGELHAAARSHAARNLGSGGVAPGNVFASDVLVGLPEHLRGRIDVIAAVPPYVPEGEIGLLPREAREHEPLAALLGGEDGLRWARILIEQAAEWIAPGGTLLLELSDAQAAAAAEHGARFGFVRDPARSGDAGTAADFDGEADEDIDELSTVVLALRRR